MRKSKMIVLENLIRKVFLFRTDFLSYAYTLVVKDVWKTSPWCTSLAPKPMFEIMEQNKQVRIKNTENSYRTKNMLGMNEFFVHFSIAVAIPRKLMFRLA
jgi:hypothetical protein